jgi:hypothetical protein
MAMTKPAEVPALPDGATIPSNGGVVVESRHAAEPPASPPAGDATPPAGDPPVDLVHQDLGRDLYVRRPPPRPVGAGLRTLRFNDESGGIIHLFVEGPAAPALAAPRLRRVGSDATPADARRGDKFGSPSGDVTIDLRDDPPAEAYALLVYGPRQGDDTALMWTRATGRRRFVLSTGGKGCNGGPGLVYRGNRLRFAWLSRDGRISPRTPWIAVGAPVPEAP